MIDYVYNNRRQLELEKVTTLGGATDGHVRSIKREYDPELGRMFRVTSHGDVAASDTMIRNQVKLTYNDLDQLTVSEQSHEDDADGSKPKVQYAYDAASSSSVFTCPSQKVRPGWRVTKSRGRSAVLGVELVN